MDALWIRIVDANFNTISDAEVHAVSVENRTIKLQAEDDRWVGTMDRRAFAVRLTATRSARRIYADPHKKP